MSSVRCPPSNPLLPGVVGIFIFLIALGIIQMDIGGRSDCRCRLDDKFFFRSTLGPVLFCPFLLFLSVSQWKTHVINYPRFVCGWLPRILPHFLFRFLRRLKMVARQIFSIRRKWELIVAIRDRLTQARVLYWIPWHVPSVFDRRPFIFLREW